MKFSEHYQLICFYLILMNVMEIFSEKDYSCETAPIFPNKHKVLWGYSVIPNIRRGIILKTFWYWLPTVRCNYADLFLYHFWTGFSRRCVTQDGEACFQCMVKVATSSTSRMDPSKKADLHSQAVLMSHTKNTSGSKILVVVVKY